MKIGVLGSGDVGKVLGAGLAGAGHSVKIGSRTPDKLKDWAAETGKGASTGTFAEAAVFGEVIVFAAHGQAAQEVIRLAGPENFKGKLVLDTTNPLEFSTGKPMLFVGMNNSLGEQIQGWLPQAKVVKAFNTVGSPHMVNPSFSGGKPDMFLCGNDEAAKVQASQICGQLGWPTVDFGGIERSRELESLCILWCMYGFKTNTWGHAFALLKK